MDMKDSRVIKASQEKVWAALNDPAMLSSASSAATVSKRPNPAPSWPR